MAKGLSVNIKMYKVHELGDCFLLHFEDGDNKSNVLIDCGSFSNSKTSKARMEQIVTDIKAQLNEADLDVIVGTHQHNDHLSGFVHAKSTFDTIKVKNVWLSWLDNPDDQQATKIGHDYNNYLANLQHISLRLGRMEGAAASDAKAKVDDVLGFSGVTQSLKEDKVKQKLPPTIPAQAIEILKKIGSEKPQYLSPGQVINLPGMAADAVKVYVLGPPKNEKLLKDTDPDSTETYDPQLAATNAQAEKFLLALKTLSSGGSKEADEQPYPFNEPYDESANYDAVWKAYYHKNQLWRQIDEDWLKQAERLALYLDSYTNNSSLVLAFELVKANKVLLFVGDAQTGNWTSWDQIAWSHMPAGFNWRSLMEKTVLYKVGHHCSHNATLVEGLKAMTNEELVAMIPVDISDTHITKQGWKMPAKNLYERIKDKTNNRVLRMDTGIIDAADPNFDDAWKGLNKPKDTELFIEYEVQG